MTGPEQEPTPLNMPRLEAHIQAALSAGLLTPDLTWNLHASHRSDDHPAFRALVEALRGEPLLQDLDGKIMNTGRGGGGFNLRKLAFWLVSRSCREGVNNALALLSRWAPQDYNDGFDLVLLSGVTVEEPLPLHGGISLTPIEALPRRLLRSSWNTLQDARTSLDTLVRFNTPSTYIFECLLPSTALIRPAKFRPRAWHPDKLPKMMSEGPPLEELCWCFAALESCWPQPHAYYGVLADSVPAADLVGGSHSEPPQYYALGNAALPLQKEDRTRTQWLFQRFEGLSDSKRKRLLAALEWLSMSKRRGRMEQKFVDLAIVLESLLAGEGSVDQIALAVRTRGAWLSGTNYEDRRKVHDLIKALYEARSKIVHGGRIAKWRITLGGRNVHVAHIIPDATQLCEKTLSRMIEDSREPEWTSVVLGQDEQKTGDIEKTEAFCLSTSDSNATGWHSGGGVIDSRSVMPQ